MFKVFFYYDGTFKEEIRVSSREEAMEEAADYVADYRADGTVVEGGLGEVEVCGSIIVARQRSRG